LPDLREPARRGADGRATGGRRGNEDDPLTSKAWSREELVNTDGRSYRVASRRAQVTPDQCIAALTEQTQTFSMNAQYQADPRATTGGYPVRGAQAGQQPGYQEPQRGQHHRQPSAAQDGTASYPYPSQPYPSRSAATDQEEDRYYRPARHGGNGNGYNGNGGGGGNGYAGGNGYGGGNGGYGRY
jgi:hypothetical protein